jgi:hypothetical protein
MDAHSKRPSSSTPPPHQQLCIDRSDENTVERPRKCFKRGAADHKGDDGLGTVVDDRLCVAWDHSSSHSPPPSSQAASFHGAHQWTAASQAHGPVAPYRSSQHRPTDCDRGTAKADRSGHPTMYPCRYHQPEHESHREGYCMCGYSHCMYVPCNTPATIERVIPMPYGRIEPLGPPHLQIYRASLPFDAGETFEQLIAACESYAQQQQQGPYGDAISGWETHMYSLTKQDIAVADVPGGLSMVAAIQDFVQDTIRRIYGQPILYLDRNQPHVLKYDGQSSHRSVPLHHDRCHGMYSVLEISCDSSELGGLRTGHVLMPALCFHVQ